MTLTLRHVAMPGELLEQFGNATRIEIREGGQIQGTPII